MLKRLTRSAIKRLPGGRAYLQRRNIYKNYLFQPGVKEIYAGLNGKQRDADAVYLPAFDRIFLLLSAFYKNGLRGDVLEFGVMLGYSAKILASCMRRFGLDASRLHLFDSFEGLPEGSLEDQKCYECVNGAWQKGILSAPEGLEQILRKELSLILGEGRLSTIRGYFEQTLDAYLQKKSVQKALLINLDCDLYSSSKYVLRSLIEHQILQDGTLIICDDWMTSFGNPNLGQRKAVKEVLSNYPQWEFELYFNFGLGSHVFVAHDLSITQGVKLHEDTRCCSV